MMKNWMTTVPGILIALNVAWRVYQNKTMTHDDVVEILAGFGLIGAKDFNVTGGTKNQ